MRYFAPVQPFCFVCLRRHNQPMHHGPMQNVTIIFEPFGGPTVIMAPPPGPMIIADLVPIMSFPEGDDGI